MLRIMLHLDYEDGYFKFPDLAGKELISYTVYDPEGRKVEITRKNQTKHDSPDPMHNNPHYHYNLGSIVMNPDEVQESTSSNPIAQEHRKLGNVLTYIKNDFIMSLNLPESLNYLNARTEVIVQYTTDKNFTRTNIIKWRREI